MLPPAKVNSAALPDGTVLVNTPQAPATVSRSVGVQLPSAATFTPPSVALPVVSLRESPVSLMTVALV